MLVLVLESPGKTAHEDEADIQDNHNSIKMRRYDCYSGESACPSFRTRQNNRRLAVPDLWCQT
jgi:hypothetical protein